MTYRNDSAVSLAGSSDSVMLLRAPLLCGPLLHLCDVLFSRGKAEPGHTARGLTTRWEPGKQFYKLSRTQKSLHQYSHQKSHYLPLFEQFRLLSSLGESPLRKETMFPQTVIVSRLSVKFLLGRSHSYIWRNLALSSSVRAVHIYQELHPAESELECRNWEERKHTNSSSQKWDLSWSWGSEEGKTGRNKFFNKFMYCIDYSMISLCSSSLQTVIPKPWKFIVPFENGNWLTPPPRPLHLLLSLLPLLIFPFSPSSPSSSSSPPPPPLLPPPNPHFFLPLLPSLLPPSLHSFPSSPYPSSPSSSSSSSLIFGLLQM